MEGSMKFFSSTEPGAPRRSVVGLIDILLVIIAALLITITQNPMMDAFLKQDAAAHFGGGRPDADSIVKNGEPAAPPISVSQAAKAQGIGASVQYRMPGSGAIYATESSNAH